MPLMTADIQIDIDKLNNRIEKIRGTLHEAEETRDALQRTLEFYLHPQAKDGPKQAHYDVGPDDLRGMTLREAVLYLAQRNNGELHSTAARGLIVASGVIQETSSRQVIYHLMSGWSLFENVRRGVYKLSAAATDNLAAPKIRAV